MPDNIIEFPGRRGEDFNSDQPDQEKNREYLNVENLAKMLNYLTALKKSSGLPKRENIELRRKSLLEPASDEELINIANASSEAEWQTRPTYYDAVIAELLKRNLLPRFERE